MRSIISMLKYDARNAVSAKIVITILILLVFTLGFAQYGIYDYKKSLENKESFQDVEKNLVDIYATYRHYAAYGFRVVSLPAPISILFTSSTVLQDMTAIIETGYRLNIYKPLKGKNIFEFSKNWFADYSGILFFFGSLVAHLFGFLSFANKKYQQILASILGKKGLFGYTLIVKAIELALFFLLFIAAAVLLSAINGIYIGIDRYLVFFLIKLYVVSLIFLLLGSVFGQCKLKIFGLTGTVISFFLLLFAAPTIVNMIIAINSNSIKSEYKLEMEKLKLMMDFEKSSNEKAGIFGIKKKPTDIDRELVFSYYKNEFITMQALEDELKTQIESNANLLFKIASFCPTTSYLVLTNELSSKGYKTLLAHYEEVKQFKNAFFKEFMVKVYFSDDSKVEPFLKGDANVLTAKPALPDYFLEGILIDLLWIAALLIPSYFRFKKNLFELPENKEDTQKHYDVVLQSKSFKSWNIFSALFFKQMYNILSNEIAELKKKGYDLDVYFDGQELNTVNKKQNFFALCHPTQIPGYLNVIHFIEMMMDLLNVDKAKRKEIPSRYSLTSFRSKCFRQLDMNELGQVFLAILDMKIFDIYLLNDIARDMSTDFCIALKDRMDALCESGASVLFLYSSTEYLVFKNSKPSKYFAELYHWYNVVEDLKARNDDETTEC